MKQNVRERNRILQDYIRTPEVLLIADHACPKRAESCQICSEGPGAQSVRVHSTAQCVPVARMSPLLSDVRYEIRPLGFTVMYSGAGC